MAGFLATVDFSNPYFAVLVLLVIALAMSVGFVLLSQALGPKRYDRIKYGVYECGVDPVTPASVRVSVKFYLLAILFILFDLETAFLYPWAVLFRSLGPFGTHYDLSRFGAEVVRFSPRQADVLLVAGTINYKMAPVMKRIYDQMLEPKWVISMGACASSGGFYNNYTVLQGIDKILPVDVYIPGCPPNPEGIIDAVVQIQKIIETGAPRAAERWPIK